MKDDMQETTDRLSARPEEAAGVMMASVASLAGEISGVFTVPPGNEVPAVVYPLIAAGHSHR